jgi:mannose-6-phosphate isomerase-like protein (cupin superfamily)
MIVPADAPHTSIISRQGVTLRLEVSRHRAREANWAPWRLDGFEARDTGIAAATNGLAAARVVKTDSAITASANAQAGELLFLFILQGELWVDSPAQGNHQLQAGDSCVIPAGVDYTLWAGAGLEMLEVSLPAEHYSRSAS